jgi:acetyl esterase/lipase
MSVTLADGTRSVTAALIAMLLGLLLVTASTQAAEPKTELLWPEGAPNALGSEPKDKPALIIYLPEGQTARAGVVICPGGGYARLAMDHEGHAVAQWLNSIGIAGFVCHYRHRGKGYGHPAPLQDAQRAIRTLRSRATEFGIAADRVGILGFSAGGHLASSALTHFDAGKGDSPDPIERVSSRPDFGILCYPVIAFQQPYTHRGSQTNLLGKDASDELIRSMSSELQVTSSTPPTFLWHTSEDTGVPPENSQAFYAALKKAKVPAELHIFEKGRHGLGLATGTPGTEQWPKLCELWLRGRL